MDGSVVVPTWMAVVTVKEGHGWHTCLSTSSIALSKGKLSLSQKSELGRFTYKACHVIPTCGWGFRSQVQHAVKMACGLCSMTSGETVFFPVSASCAPVHSVIP